MRIKHKSSLLFWGNSLINFSILSEKIEICKSVEELLKIKINKSKLFIFNNYTGKRRITIEQDIYSKFIRYNIFCHYKNYFTI